MAMKYVNTVMLCMNADIITLNVFLINPNLCFDFLLFSIITQSVFQNELSYFVVISLPFLILLKV